MLENLIKGLLSLQKQLLYRKYIMSLYKFPLWFYNKALLSFSLKELRKMQRRAAIWILGVFHISLTKWIEILAGLTPIHLYLKKLSGRSQLRVPLLPRSHTIRTLLKNQHPNLSLSHCLLLENMTAKQRQKIKRSITDANSHLNSLFPAFNTLNSEFSPGFQLSDKFPSHFSFHQANHKNKESKDSHLHKLDHLFDSLRMDFNTVIVISNASLKDNVTMSISHIHSHSEQVKKTVHHAVNVTTTEAELLL